MQNCIGDSVTVEAPDARGDDLFSFVVSACGLPILSCPAWGEIHDLVQNITELLKSHAMLKLFAVLLSGGQGGVKGRGAWPAADG